MYPNRNIIVIFLILFFQSARGQEYEPPSTCMPGNLVDDFIRMHIEYPREAIRNGEQGVVIIGYETNREGKITHTEIIKSVSPSIDSAALRLFRLILWKPARKVGKPVDGRGEFRIKYNIRMLLYRVILLMRFSL